MSDLNAETPETLVARQLTADHLGRRILVTSKSGSNTITGELRGIKFVNYDLNAKHGVVFDSILTVGDVDVHVSSIGQVSLGHD